MPNNSALPILEGQHSDLLVSVSEFIKDRFYFVTLRHDATPRSTANTHYFNTDAELTYENFYDDFGPLNLAMLYRYCHKVNAKLQSHHLSRKKLVHYTSLDDYRLRTNAAFLSASYAVLYLKMTPEEAYRTLMSNKNLPSFVPYRDASLGEPFHGLTLPPCLSALRKAKDFNFFNFEDFDTEEYEYYEKVHNGDFNWLLPLKFLAFCGPHNENKTKNGYTIHSPATYFDYFATHGIKAVIRLNKKLYDAQKFRDAGFDHHEMYFMDGSCPSNEIMHEFIRVSENTNGGLAVHCKAGLGRTGSLIGCYIMKHFKFTADETIAWLRICRPGSIIGAQQTWLKSKERGMWLEGEVYGRNNRCSHSDRRFPYGVYSIRQREILTGDRAFRPMGLCDDNANNKISPKDTEDSDCSDSEPAVAVLRNVLSRVDTLQINDKKQKRGTKETTVINGLSQGDRLNKVKQIRSHMRSATTGRINNEKCHVRTKSSPPTSSASGPVSIASMKSPLKAARGVSTGTSVPKTTMSGFRASIHSLKMSVSGQDKEGLKRTAKPPSVPSAKREGGESFSYSNPHYRPFSKQSINNNNNNGGGGNRGKETLVGR